MLHEPHADVQLSGCISAFKILTAARAILDLVYNVWSTSFDITLLDTFCSVCHDFFAPIGIHRNLTFSSVGFSVVGSLSDSYRLLWQHKISIRYPCCDRRLTFCSESYSHLNISAKSNCLCSMAIAKLGQRLPLAHRFARMLGDLIIKDCGAVLEIPVQTSFNGQMQDSPLRTLLL